VQRIALYTFSILVLGAILPLACTQNFGQFASTGGSSSSSSSSSSMSTSSGGMCTDAADCTPSATKCVTVSCMDKKCASADAPQGSACTDMGGAVCDGNGNCVACEAPTDCPAQATLCLANTCNNNMCGTMEAPQGTACTDNNGKVCNNAGVCIGCNSSSDCTGGDVCMGGACVSATCNDGSSTDDMKTDVDCGGPNCPACGIGKMCLVARDCTTGVCTGDMCVTCGQDSDCASGNFCDPTNNGGTCTPAQATGASCSNGDGTQCSTGFCADGYCCDMACTGTCEACSGALKGGGNNGHCGAIKVGTDPKMQCNDQGMASCGNDGSCDGNGACQDYPVMTPCAMATCSMGESTTARTCNGTGTCLPGTMTPCSPYGCNGTTCGTTCMHDTDCASGNYCNTMTNKCVPAQATGATCTGNDGNQCTSGFCANGVCCGTACNGPCDLCGATGTCGDAAAGTTCATGICNGTGNGATACVQCVTNANCAGVTGKPVCNTATNTCVQCTATSMAACTGGTAVCDTAIDTCVACTGSSMTACVAPTPVCDTTMDMGHDTCVACNVNTDCTSMMCNMTAHTCM
jgi:hypothetical protein